MPGSNSSVPVEARADEPLALTVHTVGTPDLAEPVQAAARRTAIGRLKMLLVLMVCAAPVVASYLTYFVIRPDGRTNYSHLIQPTRGMPTDLALRGLDGQVVKASSLRGQWLLVAVAPAACDADCEKRLFMQRQLREMLGRERDRVDKVWFIIDDGVPAPSLRQATQDSPVPVTTLRVPREQLAAWLSPEAGRVLEDHLYLIDPMGEWMMRMPAQPEPGRLKRDLDRVLRASSSWDKAGR
jgi:hypothetical protein